ncbi:zeatin O-xylosyltransferase-like [Rhododendron vialii]|uniref:zeatin O-xylosyltransferase-like n=1 Tax=Rhododendron vialii TaxID=182163 RepID=UPI00265F0387|nr:zeatin O-xylosyltransferase-like [Rhododendron vialii]
MDTHSKDSSHAHSSISKQAEVVVITVPFPCHSHLNQLLHLSCLISSSYNIPVHYATASTHLRQAKLRFNDTTHFQNSQLHFHEFPTPDFLSPSPTPNPSNKFPTHLQPSFESSIRLRQPMAALLQNISATARKVIVIHDFMMAYVVQDIANFPNAKSYTFTPTCSFSSFFDGWQMMGKPLLEKPPPKGLPSIEGCYPTELLNLVARQIDFLKFTTGHIYNSCKSIEGTYIDLIAKDEFNKLVWSIGPLNLGGDYGRSNSNTPKNKCLEWLDKQAPKSVLYVSFGTTVTMTGEEIKELAMGLEQSKQKFLWVFRDADKGDIFTGEVTKEKLPEGFEERVKEVGRLVRDWAPQVEILGHPSTGGFMSHCGWNSCLESITMGVPIATWPMHSDQPKNAFLVTDILKVGLPVNTWEQREETVTSSTIAKVVQNLIASKEGEEIRKRAEELGASTRQAVEEGGVSRMELDSFIAHITRY